MKEILAGDKQLAEEIEFDLRKFEEREREEEEQLRREEQAKIKRQRAAQISLDTSRLSVRQHRSKASATDTRPTIDVAAAGDAHDELPDVEPERSDDTSADGAPRAKETTGSDDNDQEGDDEREDDSNLTINETALKHLSPKKPTAVKDNLLKTAVMNSHKIAARRNSLAVIDDIQEEETCVKKARKIAAALQKRRASIATDLSSSRLRIVISADETNQAKQALAGPSSGETNLSQDMRRQELLRAISTPTRDDSIIRHITFINQTHEVSAIGANVTLPTTQLHDNLNREAAADLTERGEPHETLLLHLRSPEAFAKDSEFDRMRRKPAKRSLAKSFKKGQTKPETDGTTEKKKSGGFMESYSSETNETAQLTDTNNSSVC